MATFRSTAFFFFSFTFCRLSFTEDRMVVSVKSSRQPVQRMTGESLTLNCTMEYDEVTCINPKALWQRMGKEPLNDTDKYLIHINETKMREKPGFRKRDTYIQLVNLSLTDADLYQCTGECLQGPTAMGWHLNLTVTAAPDKTQENDRNGHNRCSADVILLIASLILLHGCRGLIK
ncbi:hypothetical protein NFI96_027386 [Prochilodus magdalenae]|nr:hypothetical protein NFI96_027386 [Prochilodus magdalenae]